MPPVSQRSTKLKGAVSFNENQNSVRTFATREDEDDNNSIFDSINDSNEDVFKDDETL